MQSIMRVLLLVSAAVCVARAETLGSSFAYSVSDPSTGDHKDQQEIRAGDSVTGFYRTLDPDGLMRTVNYRADPLNGFNADVAPIIAGRAALPYAQGIHPSSRVVAPLATVPALNSGILSATAPIIAARSALSPLAAMPALTSGIVPATAAGIAPIVAADGLARSSMWSVQYHPQRAILAAPAAAAVVAPAGMAATNWNMWNQPAAAVLPAAGINTLPLDWAIRK